MGKICTECGNEYKNIGNHWSMGSCGYPEFSQHQREIITGLLMGDGCINRTSKNPFIECNMVTDEYIEYIDSAFGIFSNDTRLKVTSEESAKNSRDSGFRPDASKENYQDVYNWRSMCHPELQEFANWYSTGEKVWPEDISLTPTVLKHWYCGDGTWDNKSTNNRIQIAMSNEANNTDKISDMFKRAELPQPTMYNKHQRSGGGFICAAVWGVDESQMLWKYMGDPLPGFSYKWPEVMQ